MLEKRHGKAALRLHAARHEQVTEQTIAYDEACIRGENHEIYQFGEGVNEGPALGINRETIHVPGLDQPISLSVPHPYEDMS